MMNKDIKEILNQLRCKISDAEKLTLVDELEVLIRGNTELNLKYVREPVIDVNKLHNNLKDALDGAVVQPVELPAKKNFGPAFDEFAKSLRDLQKD